jgi:hypothetical protein
MTVDRELEVSEVKDGRDELTGLSNMTFGESGIFQRVLEMFESKAVIVSSILSGIA